MKKKTKKEEITEDDKIFSISATMTGLSVSKTLQPKPASKLLKTGLPPSLFNPDIHINWKKRMSSVISFVP